MAALLMNRKFLPCAVFAILLFSGSWLQTYPAGNWLLIPVMLAGLLTTSILRTEEWLKRLIVAIPLTGVLFSGDKLIIGNYILDWHIFTTGAALVVLYLCRKEITIGKSELKLICAGLLPVLFCAAGGSLLAGIHYDIGIRDLLMLMLALGQAIILGVAVYEACRNRNVSIFLLLLTSSCVLTAGRL